MVDDGDVPESQWAADPTGRHDFRYWDGHRWTDHVSDGAEPPRDPPPAPAGQPVTAEPVDEAEPVVVAEPVATRAEWVAAPAEPVATPSRARRHSPPHSPPPSSGGVRNFLLGALVGALVVAAAVAAAVFAFKVQVNNPSTHSSARSTSNTTLASTTTVPVSTTTTLPAGRPPPQVGVTVLNGAGIPKGASMKAFALGALGYKIVGVGDAPARQGTIVQCKPGFDAEAATLAKNVGPGATTAPFPTPAPTTTADCLVTLGK